MDYQSENAQTIDRWVDEGWQWGVPISHDAFVDAQHGSWNILLTPTKPVPHEWVGDVRGKRVLGLASGGAQQMPVMAALGAQCTVLDYSSRQCEREYEVADREGYDIEVIQADMTQPLPFADESFDLIINPVSNCYIEQVKPVFRECYRVLKPGGSLIGGYDNGINYIFDNEETGSGTKQGAHSPLLRSIMERLCTVLAPGDAQAFPRSVARSFMISADDAHAWHPNYNEKYCPTNHALMGGGPAVKINANCKYMTDADGAAVMKALCEKAGVKCQYFVNHSDVAGGSTLGNILTGQLALRGVDMGAPIWAMHSARETAAVADHIATVALFTTFFA